MLMTKKSNSDRQPRPKKGSVRPKRHSLQRLRRRDLIVLTGLLFFASVVVAAVVLLILSSQPAGLQISSQPAGAPRVEPVHTVTFTQVTGLTQFNQAQPAGQAWAADAQLVGVSAVWRNVYSVGQVGEPTEWSYRFFSPSRARLFVVKIGPDYQLLTFEHVARISPTPPTLAPDEWLIDSPAALAIWLDYGGAELLRRNPGSEVLAQLRTINNHAGPVWLVVGLDNRTQASHTVIIDAIEGEVVSTDSSIL